MQILWLKTSRLPAKGQVNHVASLLAVTTIKDGYKAVSL
jgi:hypothetical protein